MLWSAAIKRPKTAPSVKTEFIERLNQLATREGFNRTLVDDVMLYRSETPIRNATLMYEPCVVIVAQQYKMGFLGSDTFVYDSGHYLVVPTLLPFQCDAEGSPDKPFLAMSVPLQYQRVGRVIHQMHIPDPPAGVNEALIYAEPITEAIEDASLRLLRCLQHPMDARVLGPQLVQEIVYRVLQGTHARLLFDLFSTGEQRSRMTRALRYIHEHLDTKIEVETLAKMEGMSISSFHEKFKQITTTSPLQYIKSVRLNRARDLITFQGHNASAAAHSVGYQSVSQFSREFKRYFGYRAKDTHSHYPIQKHADNLYP